MATMTEEAPVCKYCDNMISSKRQSDPEWDGETCSIECEEALDDLLDDTGWDDEDDEWMELDAARYYGSEDNNS